MQRFDILNYLIKKRGYTHYLEIGTNEPFRNYDKVVCEHKECCDPVPLSPIITYRMGSDEAFEIIKRDGKKYDIIFIDGLHHKDQVDRDIVNSLDVLKDGGIIILHDCNPPSKHHGLPFTEWLQGSHIVTGGAWNGTTYQSIVNLRVSRPDLNVCVVDTDWGCGVVFKGSQVLFDTKGVSSAEVFTYEYFEKNRRELLNMITPEEFLKRF